MKREFQKRIISTLILIPLTFFFIIKGSFFFIFLLITGFAVTSYEWYMMTKKKKYHLIGYFFLILSFYSAYLLRNFDNDEKGILFFFVIIICISTDIGGYAIGKIFKGPKITKISPNKTYAGMVGGYLLSLVCLSIITNYIDYLGSYFKLFLITVLISTVSQTGDIIVSSFKRKAGVKNTGNLIPGHGGLLDRIDGMIFAVPTFYLIKITGFINI